MIQLLEFLLFCYFFSYFPGYCLKYVVCLFFFYFFEKYQTKFLRYFFNIELASGMDLVFAYEDKQNKSLILACTIIDGNFDENLKNCIFKNIQKEKKYNKLKESLFKNNFFAYWKKDLKFNIDNHFEFIDKEVKDEKELYEFMGNELGTAFTGEHPKWKLIVFKKFQKTKGAVVMKFHHTLVDGISMLSFFLNSTDLENVKFVKMPKINRYKWIYIYLSLPIVGLYYLFLMVIRKTDNNKIHGFELSGTKKVFSIEIKQTLTELKVISKRLRISINDLFTSVLMECLADYYKMKFKEDLEDIIIFLPFNLRPLPSNGVACTLNNTMIPLLVKLKIIREEDKEILAKKYGKKLLAIKNSLEAPSLFLLIHYAPKLLPNFIFEAFSRFMSSRPSFGFSNVPGPLEKLKYRNSNVEKMFFFVPSVSKIGLGFSLFTYNNRLVFGVQADEKTLINPEKLANKYQNLMDIYIKEAMNKILGDSPLKNGLKK